MAFPSYQSLTLLHPQHNIFFCWIHAMKLFRRLRRRPGNNTDPALPRPPPYSAAVQTSHIEMRKADSSQCAKVSAQTTTQMKPPHSLVDLPESILVQIKAYLAPAFRATLALTNRHLLRTMGADTTVSLLSPTQRDTFLRLLHRDLEPDIYCIPCGKLHDPIWYDNRKCPDMVVRDVPGGSACGFPLSPHFAVVRALMRP
jgi:hypothetical protein